jgi:flagellar P-ring protein precursor FlgI
VKRTFFYLFLLLGTSFLFFDSTAWGARLKDISAFIGIRSNQLVGYGLVVGLNGTGDGSNTEFTIRAIVNMLDRMGIHINNERISQIKLKNVAAVMVTAHLPPFARNGSRLDVHVSSMGDATSLMGGTLLLTPLKGADQQIYAVAQGPLVIGGFAVSGASGSGVQKNHPTVGLISKGAIVEKEIPLSLDGKEELDLTLFQPDFTTAENVKEAVNRFMGGSYSKSVDSGTIKISIPPAFRDRVAECIASLEKLEVVPDTIAKVILNERTGTVVMGENVRISTVAVAHGNLSIQIKEQLNVSQPQPFAPAPPAGAQPKAVPPREGTGAIVAPGGATVVTPESNIAVKEEGGALIMVPSAVSLGEMVRALNAIGATPRDLMSILQSIKAAGALQADLEIY